MEIKLRKSTLYPFLAWVFAALVAKALMIVVSPYLQDIPYVEEPTYVKAAVSGLLMALTQWAVLRNYLKQADLWAIITFAGVTANALLMEWLSPSLESFFQALPNPSEIVLVFYFSIIQGLQGALVGGFQWVSLRTEVRRAGHWVWGAALASILSTMVNYGLLELVLARVGAANITSAQLFPLSLATTAANAIVSGIVLVWLLGDPVEEGEGVEEEEEELE